MICSAFWSAALSPTAAIFAAISRAGVTRTSFQST